MFGLDPKDFFIVGMAVLSNVIAISAWLRKPGEDAMQSVQALRERLGTLEERVRHMPNSDELTALEGSLMAVQAQIAALMASISTQAASLQRIENYLLTNKAS
jgi:predicted  nucleic acid-binding Zn-ribbon protein